MYTKLPIELKPNNAKKPNKFKQKDYNMFFHDRSEGMVV